jgi:hypothetical protein
VPWIDLHETGGVISERMVIPLLPDGQRIARKDLLARLDAGGFLFFKRDGDRTLIFAQVPKGRGAVAGLAKDRKSNRITRRGKTQGGV